MATVLPLKKESLTRIDSQGTQEVEAHLMPDGHLLLFARDDHKSTQPILTLALQYASSIMGGKSHPSFNLPGSFNERCLLTISYQTSPNASTFLHLVAATEEVAKEWCTQMVTFLPPPPSYMPPQAPPGGVPPPPYGYPTAPGGPGAYPPYQQPAPVPVMTSSGVTQAGGKKKGGGAYPKQTYVTQPAPQPAQYQGAPVYPNPYAPQPGAYQLHPYGPAPPPGYNPALQQRRRDDDDDMMGGFLGGMLLGGLLFW